ncbi:MAG: DUF2851 family protein [Rikenellaceae bacterium]
MITLTREQLLVHLKCGAKGYKCGMYLHKLEALFRQPIYHRLEHERLMRKYEDIRQMYLDYDKDWNRVLLSLLFRTFSDESQKNKRAYAKLGGLFEHRVIEREKDSLENLEAMFVVASGLYHTKLKRSNSFACEVVQRGRALLKKHGVEEMSSSEWSSANVKGATEPIIRMSQIAMLIHKSDMLFNKVKNLRTRDDVLALFNLNASDEWSRFYGGGESKYVVGVDKRDMIGINFVVPMLYAIGNYFDDGEITDAADEINEAIPAENNRFIRGWRSYGLTPISAYETQSLLELATSYCRLKSDKSVAADGEESNMPRCESCPIYEHIVGPKSILNEVPNMLVL